MTGPAPVEGAGRRGETLKILLPTLYETRGGSTRVLLATAVALRQEHAVTVRAPLAEADDPARALFPGRPLIGLGRKLAVLPRLARLIVQETIALRRLRPDVIHVHDEPSLYVYGFSARLLSPRPRLVWHLHLDPSRGGILARLRTKLADACISISAHVPAPSGLPATLIRNPVSLPDITARPNPEPLAAMAVVGAIYPQKRQDLAIAALAALHRRPEGRAARLVMIGQEFDAAYATALRRQIAILGLGPAVTFAGLRPAEQAFDEVGLALFPSEAEIQPLALAEALGRRLPVVASDIPAHHVMIAETGADPATLSVPDPEAFADAILRSAGATIPSGVAQRVRALHAPEVFEAAIRAFYRTTFG